MPTFLTKTNFRNPEGPIGCFQSAFETDLQVFPWLMRHPEQLVNFNDLMMRKNINRGAWFSIADAQQVVLDGYDGKSALLVDVGGNRGTDLGEFKNVYSGAKGELVLQDLPLVIDGIKELDGEIVRMKHDFFTPQPVKGKIFCRLSSKLLPFTCVRGSRVLSWPYSPRLFGCQMPGDIAAAS